MRRLLNTLYVTTQGAYLSRDGETVAVHVEGQTKLRVPVHTLESVVCFGQVTCSAPLMGLCAERNVQICFLTENGKFLARVQGPVSGNVLLRREQYRRADDDAGSAAIARSVVIAKVANCRTVLLRAARERSQGDGAKALAFAADHMAGLLRQLDGALTLETVRGIEGEAARVYFGVFDHLIVVQKGGFFFRERSRRPPMDNMNALLSFLYTILAHDVQSALESVGLDPQVGYLHRDRPGRPGLALDLMEEFRPILVDRLVLSLVNRQQVTPDGMEITESGAVLMNEQTRKTVLVAYQERKRDEVRHPFLKEQVPIGLLPYAQALLLSRFLRNDMDAYPPFMWR